VLEYLKLALKYKYLVCALCGVFLFGGFILTVMTTKTYSSSVSIKIGVTAQQMIKKRKHLKIDPNFYKTQYELIKSRTLADRVATQLNLAETEFVGKPSVSLLDGLLGRQTTDTTAPDAAALKDRHDWAVDQIMRGLSVQQAPESSIVRIRYANSSPEWAQRITEGVAEQFGKMTLDMRSSTSDHARHFLDERLQDLKIKLETAERQLIAYAQKEGIVDVDNKQPQVMTEMQSVHDAYSQAVTSRLLLAEAWSQAQADGGTSLPQVMDDALIQAARSKLLQLRTTYQDRLNVVKPDFPEMIALRTQISEAEKDIKSQIDLIKNSIKSQYDAALANEKSLGDKLEELKRKALDLRGRSVDYRIFSREVDTIRSLYDGVLQQFRQFGVESDADGNNVSILDRARIPYEPDSPSFAFNLAVALALGLAAAAGAIWMIEILDDTFKTPEDLEENLGLSVLGITPLFRDPTGKKKRVGGGRRRPELASGGGISLSANCAPILDHRRRPSLAAGHQFAPRRRKVDDHGLHRPEFWTSGITSAGDRRRPAQSVAASRTEPRQQRGLVELSFGSHAARHFGAGQWRHRRRDRQAE
jgi:uncharacterized protein involved in exopolysaccharide biosynthesis